MPIINFETIAGFLCQAQGVQMMMRRRRKERMTMMAPSIPSTCTTRTTSIHTRTWVMSSAGVTSGGGPGASFVHQFSAPASNTLY